jgi:glycosyltransferase involved in cell wall biosynthesis/SAM-dependent methyltransferase
MADSNQRKDGGQGEKGDVELSIVMPCLNEAETLEPCIRTAAGYLAARGIRGEIVIGDNGSTDGSREIALRNGARVVDVPIRGYGAAVYHATLTARGRFVIVGDSDGSYDFSALQPFVEKLRQGYGLVMGNRFLGGIRPGAMPWKNRYLGNPLLTGLGRLFFHSPAHDFHCGLRGFSRDFFQRMDLRTTGMEFASEMVIKATLAGERIAEVPTTLDPAGRSCAPHLRPWRDGWRHLRFMLLYSPRWLFLIPGLLAMLLGGTGALILLGGDLAIGSVHLGVHTMLYAAMFVVAGFEAVCFSVFTKIFAIVEGLLPEDPRLTRLFQYVTLESGLAAGFLLLFFSAAVSFHALSYWSSTTFGPLDPAKMLRLVIPAAFAFLLGCQTILASLFMSVLGLSVRKPSVEMPISTAVHKAIHNKFVFSRRVEKLTRVLDSLIPASASILDVGCGSGLVAWRLRQLSPGREITGIDVLKREACMIPCQAYDGKTLPFSPGAFDYVMFVDVLHHTTTAEDLLLQAKRIARRGIVIKDHYCESRLDYYTLAFMDWVGNAQYGVGLPKRYKAAEEWRATFAGLGLRPVRTLEDIELYPGPFDAVFGRKLHFVSLLDKAEAARQNAAAGRGATAG